MHDMKLDQISYIQLSFQWEFRRIFEEFHRGRRYLAVVGVVQTFRFGALHANV